MRSHLLEGIVRHRRARPVDYALEHAVFYVALDLAEVDLVVSSLRLVSRDRWNAMTFRDRDHFDPPAADLPIAVRSHLRAEGVDPRGWRVTLVTNLRVLGHVFNPASFYLCRDADGVLRVVIVEVHNTHGERHLYTLHGGVSDGAFEASMAKDFYVSPFIAMAGRYRVLVRDDAARLRITINEEQEGELILHTSLDLARHPLTDRMVSRMLLRHPLPTLKTIGMIHVHALRLWLRGLTFHRHGGTTR